MRHAKRPLTLITALIAAPLMLSLACSDDGWDDWPPGGGGGNGGGGGGGGGGNNGTGGAVQSNPEEIPPGLDDSGGEEVGDIDCVEHSFRAFAYPIYANGDLHQIVSPNGGDTHALTCVGPADVSTHDHHTEITICGPRTSALGALPDEAEIVDAMVAEAVAKCEDSLLANFETHWPELEEEYEHWPGGDEDIDTYYLFRVACIPIGAEDPYLDHAAGWCDDYDDELAVLEPQRNEQDDDWEYCHEDPVVDCHVPYVHGVTGGRSACEEYEEQVATDITLEAEGNHNKVTIASALVESLLSLEVAHCEHNRYDGQAFTVIEGWSIFAAVGFRDGDRPQSVQAFELGEPVGAVFPLGQEPGQEIEAFAGLFGVNGEWPTELRVTFERHGEEMVLDLAVDG